MKQYCAENGAEFNKISKLRTAAYILNVAGRKLYITKLC
jgi:hypothetical protein